MSHAIRRASELALDETTVTALRAALKTTADEIVQAIIDEVQVVPQGGANGSADGAAHAARKGVGVRRDLVDDGLDDLVGGGRQRGPECGDRRLVKGQIGDPPDRIAHALFPANNSVEQIYVLRSGLYALRRSKLEP